MSKVLSTKLAIDEVKRFTVVAEQQGLSESGLLRHLVKEYLGRSNEESKTSTNCEPGNRCSLEKRQTPWGYNGKRLPLDKQEVSQNRELQRRQCQVHPTTCRVQNYTWPVSTDRRLTCIYSTALDSRTLARLAKAPDSKDEIARKLSVKQ